MFGPARSAKSQRRRATAVFVVSSSLAGLFALIPDWATWAKICIGIVCAAAFAWGVIVLCRRDGEEPQQHDTIAEGPRRERAREVQDLRKALRHADSVGGKFEDKLQKEAHLREGLTPEQYDYAPSALMGKYRLHEVDLRGRIRSWAFDVHKMCKDKTFDLYVTDVGDVPEDLGELLSFVQERRSEIAETIQAIDREGGSAG